MSGQAVTHNKNGDLTSIGTNTYTYDFDDRLVQLSLTNASSAFAYDGLGNRLVRSVNGRACRFVLDRTGALTQVLVETDTNNSPIAYYIYGLGLAQRITADGTIATYHFNIQGSTVALTDSGGNITDAYAYDSFGVLANYDGVSPQPFRYLGKYGILDDGTGLLYARARYWSPQLGRFFTKDIAAGKDDNGQTLNRFVYVLNNPLRFRDATGLTATEGDFLRIANSTTPIIVPEQSEVCRLNQSTGNNPIVLQVINGAVIVVQLAVQDVYLPPSTLADPAEFMAEEIGLAGIEEDTLGETEGAAQQLPNAIKGEVFEQEGLDNLQGDFQSQVSVRPYTESGGLSSRVRLDAFGINEAGDLQLIDFKSSQTAHLTPNQEVSYPLLEKYGGQVVGNNGGATYPDGFQIPPTPVTIIRPGNF